MSGLFGNHIVGLPTRRLICLALFYLLVSGYSEVSSGVSMYDSSLKFTMDTSCISDYMKYQLSFISSPEPSTGEASIGHSSVHHYDFFQ